MANENYEKSSQVGMINPYTFVPFQETRRNQSEKAEEFEELHTGVLHCTLQARTPLAVPDIEKKKKDVNEHSSYPFFQIGSQYAIPGSSLRGVLRSAYETITDSCYCTMNDNSYLSCRVEAGKVYKPGILQEEDGHLRLYQAEKYNVPIKGWEGGGKGKPGKRNANVTKYEMKIGKDGIRRIKDSHGKWVSTGSTVTFTAKGNKITEFRENENGNGKLFIGEPIFGKHSESVFEYQECYCGMDDDEYGWSAKKLPISAADLENDLKKAYDRLVSTQDVYQNPGINKGYSDSAYREDTLMGKRAKDVHTGYKGFANLDLEGGIPIWYELKAGVREKPHFRFSYAAIGRIVYDKSLNDLAGNTCQNRRELCDACKLFGMTSASGGENGRGSRIRVTDAYGNAGLTIEKNVVLKELGEPRYSYLPFYATYKGAKNGAPDSYDERNVSIAGRKYYWHNKNWAQDDSTWSFQGTVKNKRTSTMDLVMPGENALFHFDVYYDGITETELNRLLWCISLGENTMDSHKCHKIGHGKPLGLGSVKIVVEEQTERKVSKEAYQRISTVPAKTFLLDAQCNETAVESLLKITDFDQPFEGKNADYPIDYPDIVDENDQPFTPESRKTLGENNVARHQWYLRNKNEKSPQTLPNIMDSSQVLTAYRYIKNPVLPAKQNTKKSKGNNRTINQRHGQNSYNRYGSEKTPAAKTTGAVMQKTQASGTVTQTQGASAQPSGPFNPGKVYEATVTSHKNNKKTGATYVKLMVDGTGAQLSSQSYDSKNAAKVKEMFPVGAKIQVVFENSWRDKNRNITYYNFKQKS